MTDIIPSFKILMFLIFELKLMKISLCGKSFFLVIYQEKRKREVVGSGYDSDYSECFRPLLWLFWSNKLGWSPIEDHPSLFDPIWWFRLLMMTMNISLFDDFVHIEYFFVWCQISTSLRIIHQKAQTRPHCGLNYHKWIYSESHNRGEVPNKFNYGAHKNK